MTTVWTADSAMAAFEAYVANNGYISANAYDKIGKGKDAGFPDGLPGRRTLQRLTGKTWAELMGDPPQPQVTSQEYSKDSLVRQNKQLMARLQAHEEALKLFIDTCQAGLAKMNIKPVAVPKRIHSREDLEMHGLRSDDHAGAKVTERSTQGLGRYNADIYKKRLNRWVEKLLVFKDQDSSPLGLNKLVLYFMGDIITGETIYKGQLYALDLFLIDQLFFALEQNLNALLGLAGIYNSIECFCVPGNHGRPGMKGDNFYLTNFDYVLYRMLQMALRQQPNITIHVSESPSMVLRNGDFNFHISHGETVKSWSGIPYYGLDRQFNKLANLYGMLIHYQLIGHFHTPAQIGEHLIMNGTFVGGDELSINRMHVSSRPTQKIFYFHPTHGINRTSDLVLDNTPQLTADEDGIYTPHTK